MIERCPHCGADVIFSSSICPACGYESSEQDRTEPSALEIERRTSRYPTYTAELETILSAPQARGRLLLGLTSGILLAPGITYVVTGLLMGIVSGVAFLATLMLVAGGWLLLRAWEGRVWAWRLSALAAASLGIAGMLIAFVRRSVLPTPIVFLACLLGPMFLACAWTLSFSRDAREYRDIRRRHLRPMQRPSPKAEAPDTDTELV